MKLLNEETIKQLKGIFERMKHDVTISLFVGKENSSICEETRSFMEELVTITDKLHLDIHNVDEDDSLAKEYLVKMTPAIVLLDSNKNYKRIKFYGIPAGHEINSLINSIIEVSGTSQDLSEKTMERLGKVTKPIDIKVFVTLSCPHCPGAVSKAHKLALVNENIKAEMIEANTFGELSGNYNVSSVPKIVINDVYEFVGDQPMEKFLEEIEKANLSA